MTQAKRLTPAEWAQVITLYERGEKNLRELSEMFGVTAQGISQGLRSRGIEKNSRISEITNETDTQARKEREEAVKRANAMRDTYSKYNDVIARLTIKRIIEGDQNGNLSLANADILVLKNAGATIQRARIENWDILDIESLLGEDATLPDLNVGEYTPEELEAIRQANEEHYQSGVDGEDYDEDDEDLGDE